MCLANGHGRAALMRVLELCWWIWRRNLVQFLGLVATLLSPQQEVGLNCYFLDSHKCFHDGIEWEEAQREESCDSMGHNLTAGVAAVICKMCFNMALGDKNMLREC